jgi:YVTN family beta-propeller protein
VFPEVATMPLRRRQRPLRRGATIALALGLAATVGVGAGVAATKKRPAPKPKAPPAAPTWSSPIAMSADNKLVWSVNPGNDTVSVIRTDQNRVIRSIKVGDEPQGVALDPSNRYAYVANAAGSSLTVIRIANPKPGSFRASPDTRFGKKGQIVTGAEPWNVVASPNGKRVYVANSGQDTITVLDVPSRKVVGRVSLATGACNPDRNRHFQPRGMAITKDSRRLYVTRFLSFVSPGGTQGTDTGHSGLVCRLDLNTSSKGAGAGIGQAIPLAPRVTGFQVDSNGDNVADDTSAFPNQLQSIAIRGNTAYLPNIAASPSGPLRFNVDTQAFVNTIDGVNGRSQTDSSAAKFLNLHLGARDPEPGKKRVFFANAWAIAFAAKRGQGPIYGNGKGDAAYVVSAGSDVLVKVNVDGAGKLSFTDDANTTRYIDLNDPANPATSGDNAGKNPQGIVINKTGTRAYVDNFVSRNVSVVDLTRDQVVKTIRTQALPRPGSLEETVAVGAEMFFSSRGNFNRPPGTTVSTSDRLSSEGWQACSSCHFKGLTDGIVWTFNTGPRKSVPLNATWDPKNKNDQRVLNYSAIFDEVEDFEANIRNVSGPGALATAQACATPAAGQPATSTFDPNHGLLIADTGNINQAPCAINAFIPPNGGRQQLSVTLPGSTVAVPALTALKEWVRFAVRTPNGPLTSRRVKGGASQSVINKGRNLFIQAGCGNCHGGGKWTVSSRNFTPPPAQTDIFTETTPPRLFGNPVGAQYLNAFLRNIGSFNLGVAGGNNPLGNNIGAPEKATAVLANGVAQPQQDALGVDYNGDGKGNGFNVPSLLGIWQVPPYYHNGACETLACVLGNVKHRTANGTTPDRLVSPKDQAAVVAFLQSINAGTKPVGP